MHGSHEYSSVSSYSLDLRWGVQAPLSVKQQIQEILKIQQKKSIKIFFYQQHWEKSHVARGVSQSYCLYLCVFMSQTKDSFKFHTES